MTTATFDELISTLKDHTVERPNKADSGTLSGHAAGEPFEKHVYRILKDKYPDKIFKQYEFLNDLYLRNPKTISVKDRNALFDSPVAFFLLSRGDKATKAWNPNNIFEEKQNDTADILWHDGTFFDIIDVKTRNMSKKAQAPNIISAYKLAQACALMIDNEDYSSIGIHYIEVEWKEEDGKLKCTNAHWKDLFKSNPSQLYINWAAAMQIQFHVSELDQSFEGSPELWARKYITAFVKSAEARCKKMYLTCILPFKKYVLPEESDTLFSEADLFEEEED